MSKNKISILGIRGIPASHGGFETFAEGLAPYLVEQGWDVTVYCQVEGEPKIETSTWKGVNLVNIYVKQTGALSTFIFDWKSILHAAKAGGLMLTLGYNTAMFNFWFRLKGIKNIMNMDGIEWRREKWSFPLKAWFYINEKLGSWLSNHLIADHPEIKAHLERNVGSNKITVIPYGADDISSADVQDVNERGLVPNSYGIVIARPEPENSILEIVTAFSSEPRSIKLVILGNYSDDNKYHQSVLAAASKDVVFLGAIYDSEIVGCLRFHALFYAHGHQVGGTNPSLVEAMGAGNVIVAHDNKFNRWVAGDEQLYFSNTEGCSSIFNTVLYENEVLTKAAESSKQRFRDNFTWLSILQQYEKVLLNHL